MAESQSRHALTVNGSWFGTAIRIAFAARIDQRRIFQQYRHTEPLPQTRFDGKPQLKLIP
jgi:hypothetical protein